MKSESAGGPNHALGIEEFEELVSGGIDLLSSSTGGVGEGGELSPHPPNPNMKINSSIMELEVFIVIVVDLL